jgi:hypothetical protein
VTLIPVYVEPSLEPLGSGVAEFENRMSLALFCGSSALGYSGRFGTYYTTKGVLYVQRGSARRQLVSLSNFLICKWPPLLLEERRTSLNLYRGHVLRPIGVTIRRDTRRRCLLDIWNHGVTRSQSILSLVL